MMHGTRDWKSVAHLSWRIAGNAGIQVPKKNRMYINYLLEYLPKHKIRAIMRHDLITRAAEHHPGGAPQPMKTYIVAIFLFLFNVLVSIACGMGLVSVAGIGLQAGFVEVLASGLVNSTVHLPLFLGSLGISKSFAAIVAFATWFVYAVGFFQLVTVRVIGLED
jgi:hypothetical protein